MALKKKRHEEHENHERWLVSYADFITLLFAFFAVLYATSQADLERQQEFEESIKKAFASANFFGQETQSDNLVDLKRSVFKTALENFPPAGASTSEVQNYVGRKIEQDISEEERTSAGIAVAHDTLGVRIQVASAKIFNPGSADLATDSTAALDKLGELLKSSGRKLIVEGHTDNTPIQTGQFPSNWELSAARATKIVRYLIARHKIAASRLTAVAYADQKPAVPNTTEENRARNRRIELLIVTQ